MDSASKRSVAGAGIISALCLFVSLLLGPEAAALPIVLESKKQEIKNKTGQAADDLSLRFSGEVKNVSVQPPSSSASVPASGVDANTNTAFWNKGTIKPNVPSGDQKATVFWEGAAAGILVSEATFWTRSGNQIGAVTALGQPPQFSSDLAFATFLNPHSFGIIYANVQLFKDNDRANFGTDQVFSPTGTLVTSVPTAFTLSPGESIALSLGAVDVRKYQLALADASAVSTPTELFDVGAAGAVPEPTTLLLFGSTAAGLGLARWRQRRRKAATVALSG